MIRHCFFFSALQYTCIEIIRRNKAAKKFKLKPINFQMTVAEDFNDKSSEIPDLYNGLLRFSDTKSCKFSSDDFINHGIIGSGNFNDVLKIEHRASGTMIAVKYIRPRLDKKEQEQFLKKLDIFMRENSCPHFVKLYGIYFDPWNDCQIFMELMDTTFDRFYKFIYYKLNQHIPEYVLAYIAVVVLQTLRYLESRWQIIHRNVTPSNILISRTNIKLSNFGIIRGIVNYSGHTHMGNNYPFIYLSPERVDPTDTMHINCDVQHAVWSFGITMYELSMGHAPYSEGTSVFEFLERIVIGPSVKLTADRLSDHCKDFVNTCLNKDINERPAFKPLFDHPFLDLIDDLQQTENAIAYLSDITSELEQNTDAFNEQYYLPSTSQ